MPLPSIGSPFQSSPFVKSQGVRTGGTKGERRSATSQAPPLLRQRKPYLTGSPPSRQKRRYRPDVECSEYTAESVRCVRADSSGLQVVRGIRNSQPPQFRSDTFRIWEA